MRNFVYDFAVLIVLLTVVQFDRATGEPFSRPSLAPDGTKAVFSREHHLHLLNIRTGSVNKLDVQTSGKRESAVHFFGIQSTNRPFIWLPDSRRILVRAGDRGEAKWTICDTQTRKVTKLYKTAPESRVVAWAEPGPSNPVEYTHYDFARIHPSGHSILFVQSSPGNPEAVAVYSTEEKRWVWSTGGMKVAAAGWINSEVLFYQQHYGTEAEGITFVNWKMDERTGKFGSQGTYYLSPDRTRILDISSVMGSKMELLRAPSGKRTWEVNADQLKQNVTRVGLWGPGSRSFAVGFRRQKLEYLPAPDKQAPDLSEEISHWVRIYRLNGDEKPVEQQSIPEAILAEPFQTLWLEPGRWMVCGRDLGPWSTDGKEKSPHLPYRKMDFIMWDRETKTVEQILDGPVINFTAIRLNSKKAAFTASTRNRNILFLLETGKKKYKLTRLVERKDEYVPVPHGLTQNGNQILISYLTGSKENGWKTVWMERRSIHQPDQVKRLLGEAK